MPDYDDELRKIAEQNAEAQKRLASAQERANEIAAEELELKRRQTKAEEEEADADDKKADAEKEANKNQNDSEKLSEKSLALAKKGLKKTGSGLLKGSKWAGGQAKDGANAIHGVVIWTFILWSYDVGYKFYFANGNTAITWPVDLVILLMLGWTWGFTRGLLFIFMFEVFAPVFMRAIIGIPFTGVYNNVGPFVNSAVIPMWALYVGFVRNPMQGFMQILVKIFCTFYILGIIFVITAASTGNNDIFEFLEQGAYTIEERNLIEEARQQVVGETGNQIGAFFKGINIKNLFFPQDAYTFEVDYQGTAEQSQPTGIILSPSEFNNNEYRIGRSITLFGKISSLSRLEQPVIVPLESIECDIKTFKGEVQSTKDFQVNYGADQHIPCLFSKETVDEIGTGSKKGSIIMEYDFTSEAKLRAAFMEINNLREHRRNDINPFTRFDVPDADRTIQAEYTNGPLSIAFASNPPPLGIVEIGHDANFAVGDLTPFNLQIAKNKNLKTGQKTVGEWKGSIVEIKDITVLLPKGIKFVVDETTSGADVCDFTNPQEVGEGTLYHLKEDYLKIPELTGDKDAKFFCFMYATSTNEALDGKPILVKNFDVKVDYTVALKTEIPVSIIKNT